MVIIIFGSLKTLVTEARIVRSLDCLQKTIPWSRITFQTCLSLEQPLKHVLDCPKFSKLKDQQFRVSKSRCKTRKKLSEYAKEWW